MIQGKFNILNMNILVTGSNGFIGKHTCVRLMRLGLNVLSFDVDKNDDDLRDYISQADFIIHLAGINRPLTIEEFYDGNSNFTKHLIVNLNRDIDILNMSTDGIRITGCAIGADTDGIDANTEALGNLSSSER